MSLIQHDRRNCCGTCNAAEGGVLVPGNTQEQHERRCLPPI
jgi:hypothetical protein